jgi:predicted 2-oxoglutarate/Fe(II)-dependent dioxygenase YbiX
MIPYEYITLPKVFNVSEQKIKELNEKIPKEYKPEDKDLGAKGLDRETLKNSDCYNVPHITVSKILGADFLDLIYQFNKDFFGYNLYPQNYHQGFLYNVYSSDKKAEYKWHIDGVENSHTDMKLTILVDISLEPYEGGEFWVNAGNPYHAKEFTIGTIMMLKSHVLHRVTPVTKGKRISLTHFMEGPRFI